MKHWTKEPKNTAPTTPPMMTRAEVSPENWLLYPREHMISSFRAVKALTAEVAKPVVETFHAL